MAVLSYEFLYFIIAITRIIFLVTIFLITFTIIKSFRLLIFPTIYFIICLVYLIYPASLITANQWFSSK